MVACLTFLNVHKGRMGTYRGLSCMAMASGSASGNTSKAVRSKPGKSRSVTGGLDRAGEKPFVTGELVAMKWLGCSGLA